MEKYSQLVDFSSKYPNIIVALGMFDGLHIGHQEIIRTPVPKAQETNAAKEVIMTDIRARAADVAKEQGIDMIFSDYVGIGTVEDVTDDIIAKLA